MLGLWNDADWSSGWIVRITPAGGATRNIGPSVRRQVGSLALFLRRSDRSQMPATPKGDIQDVQDLLRIVDEAGGSTCWYRGHTDDRWTLVPSVARRREWLQAENLMLKRFKQDAYPRLRYTLNSEWEWLLLAQHNGIPTRLLDWSENPLVGLYFSVSSDRGQDDEPADGSFWILRPREFNKRAVPDGPEILMFGHDQVLDSYLPERILGSPTVEPVAVVAIRSFDRIVAQSGTFTINHRSHDPLEERFGDNCLECYRIPVNRKEFIRNQLRALNIMDMTVYPDLSRLGSYIKGLY